MATERGVVKCEPDFFPTKVKSMNMVGRKYHK